MVIAKKSKLEKKPAKAALAKAQKPKKAAQKALVFETPPSAPATLPALPAPSESVAPGRQYLAAVGRRKEAVAQVRLFKNGTGVITVNGKDFRVYFPWIEWQEAVSAPLKTVGQADKLDVSVKVQGGGLRGQADAVRHGISRSLLKFNPVFRRGLKKVGFLTRDPRVKERKKYGLKGARRAPQWAKR